MLNNDKIKDMLTVISIIEAGAVAIDRVSVDCSIEHANGTCYHLNKARRALSEADAEIRAAIGHERREHTAIAKSDEYQRFADTNSIKEGGDGDETNQQGKV